MSELEVFFDYVCPYCLREHNGLMDLLPHHPDLDVAWRPCESHPRPEPYKPHSDLCARGMYAALEHGVDLREYHRRMYHAVLTDHADIEDAGVLAALTEDLLDSGAFLKALADTRHKDRLEENNRLAWSVYDFPAVPSYLLNGHKLLSVPGVGVSKKQLQTFLEKYDLD